MMKIKYLIFLVFMSFLILFCKQSAEKNWVAKVGGITISEYEYQSRLNFSSFLSDIKDEQKIKKIVLASLVAEKMLAAEAISSNYQHEGLSAIVMQNQKELMIEYLRSDSVDNQITVTDAEVVLEYKRRTREMDVKYVALADLETATRLRQTISSGVDFEDAAKSYMLEMGWQDGIIPTRKILWYDKQPKMEYELYNLSEGSTSLPINAFGEYYLVKVDKINILEGSLENSFEKSQNQIRKEIRERKIADKYRDYYSKNILHRLGQADWMLIRKVVDIYVQSLPDAKNSPQLKNKALPENENFSKDEKIASLRNKAVIEFSDHSWTVEELVNNIQVGPYVFNFENDDLLKRSFKRNIQLMLEHKAWYDFAKQLEYYNDPRVMRDHDMWRNYYYAKYYQDELTEENSVYELSDKNDIGLNKETYNNARFIGHDIFLQKQHFANRGVIPPLLAVGENTAWQNKMHTLLAKEGLN